MNRQRGLLLVIAALAIGASANAQTPITIVDAAQTIVGPAVDFRGASNDPTIIVPVAIAQGIALVRVKKTGFVHNALVFESTDCTGQPYLLASQAALDSQGSGLYVRTAISDPGDTLYVHDLQAAHLKLFRSVLSHVGCTTKPVRTNVQVQGFLVNPSIDLSTRFIPPFSVRASPDVITLE